MAGSILCQRSSRQASPSGERPNGPDVRAKSACQRHCHNRANAQARQKQPEQPSSIPKRALANGTIGSNRARPRKAAPWRYPAVGASRLKVHPPTGDLRCPSESLLKTRVFERGGTEHSAPEHHLRATLAGFPEWACMRLRQRRPGRGRKTRYRKTGSDLPSPPRVRLARRHTCLTGE